LLSKILHRDVSPTSKGTDLLLILSHATTDMGFRGERSLGETFPRIGKRRAKERKNLRTDKQRREPS